MIDQIKLLNKINDEHVKKIAGTDAALYLVFLRYSSRFFIYISIFSFASSFMFLNEYQSREDVE